MTELLLRSVDTLVFPEELQPFLVCLVRVGSPCRLARTDRATSNQEANPAGGPRRARCTRTCTCPRRRTAGTGTPHAHVVRELAVPSARAASSSPARCRGCSPTWCCGCRRTHRVLPLDPVSKAFCPGTLVRLGFRGRSPRWQLQWHQSKARVTPPGGAPRALWRLVACQRDAPALRPPGPAIGRARPARALRAVTICHGRAVRRSESQTRVASRPAPPVRARELQTLAHPNPHRPALQPQLIFTRSLMSVCACRPPFLFSLGGRPASHPRDPRGRASPGEYGF